MTEYIINPMFFYWMQVADCLRDLSMLVAIVCGVLGAALLFVLTMFDDEMEAELIERLRKVRNKFLIASLVLAVVVSVVPSKNTLIEMTIAKIATVENTRNAVEAIKEATDYVFEKIEGLK